MKKVISILLCIACLCVFAACGEEKEPAKDIYVGQISVTVPEGWLEKMEENQSTFTFSDGKERLLGKMMISASADENASAITDFAGEPEETQAKYGENEYTVLSGKDAGGQTITEYHLFHKGLDYTFIFTDLANKSDADSMLSNIEPF